MEVVHTIGLPPYQGRIVRADNGWTRNKRKAPRKMAAA
jgi:hypothetical protein